MEPIATVHYGCGIYVPDMKYIKPEHHPKTVRPWVDALTILSTTIMVRLRVCVKHDCGLLTKIATVLKSTAHIQDVFFRWVDNRNYSVALGIRIKARLTHCVTNTENI